MFSYLLLSLLHGHREPHPGVFFCQDLFLFFQVDLGIDLGGHDRTMAKQGLDILDIDVVFQEQGGKGMTEDMRGHLLADLGYSCKIADKDADRLIGELIAQTIDQEVTAVRRDPGGEKCTIRVERKQRIRITELDHALFATLAVNGHRTRLQVKCATPQVGDLRYPCPRRKQQLDHHGIAQGFQVTVSRLFFRHNRCVYFF